MLTFIKNAIKRTITIIVKIFSRNKLGKFIIDIVIKDIMNNKKSVIHNNLHLKFTTPNWLNNFRINTFATKEPETLDWIDSFPKNSILWDIGANVGLYSIYAAKARNCQVIAFEPSVFNLELLARNIFINNLQKQIKLFPLPLTNEIGSNKMSLTTMEWGGALSSFGENIGWDGKPINDVFSFYTYGCSMDQSISIFDIPQPHFIKMDVDGIEHIILDGGENILKKIKGILIEINDDYIEQATKAKIYLENAGLTLDKKLHSKIMQESTVGFVNTFNQIWSRKDTSN